jgi:two-component system, LytTR family, sensor kinase
MAFTEKRTKLNDRLILLLGIPAIAITGVLVLGRGIIREHELSILVTIFGSTLSTLVIWLGVRKIVIYLWDKYPWEKDPVRHLLIEIAAIITYTMMAGVFLSLFWLYFKPDYIRTGNLGMNIFFSLIVTFFITSLHEGWFFFQQWKKTLVLSEKLSKENIQSQFETLKSQVSPHFLFNNLNTLASLIEEDQKLAIEYVQRTADYYRNILRLKDHDVIALEDELTLIGDYYYLQKKRYGSKLNLRVNISPEYRQSVVAPLTLQMLFENAIKHNIISENNPLGISIYSEDGFIVVENNLQSRESDPDPGGIGLKNISNRYRFLSNREIIIVRGEDTFVVKIPVLEIAQ